MEKASAVRRPKVLSYEEMPVAQYVEGRGWVGWEEQQKPWFKQHAAREHFQIFRHPSFWEMWAISLHDAAVMLWNIFDKNRSFAGRLFVRPKLDDFPRVAFMLGGMSVEVLLKAHRLSRRDVRIPVSDAIMKQVTTGRHDLVKIASDMKVRTNAKDRQVLAALSHYVRWGGRYPLPKELAEYEQYWLMPGGDFTDRWAEYMVLHKKIAKRVNAAVKAAFRREGKRRPRRRAVRARANCP